MVIDDDFTISTDWRIRVNQGGYAHIRSYQGVANKKSTFKYMFVHRVVVNANKEDFVDHINGNKLDNRLENLRICSNLQNQWNRMAKGYHKTKQGTFSAHIVTSGKTKYLGVFEDEWRAAMAYKIAHVNKCGKFSPYFNEITK
jgi:hypothetical protein